MNEIASVLPTEEYYKLFIETEHINRLREHLQVKDVVSSKFRYTRVGNVFDGGYVMLDDFNRISIAYSFGIAEDISWDMDVAKHGIDIYIYV